MRFRSKEPSVHTFIFIKQKLSCAKTIVHKHLGVLYERHVKSTSDNRTATIVQGLAGRLTGYHENKTSVVFTDLEQIKIYYKGMENEKTIEENREKANSRRSFLRPVGGHSFF